MQKDKIKVFYSPITNYSINEEKNDFLKNESITARKYYLIISGSIWIKNSYRAVKAFDDLVSQGSIEEGYKMVVTGVDKNIFSIKNPDSFILKKYVPREELEILFKNAYSLIYPTLNEGFGYPVLETLKYGVPVLASGIGPIPEIGGDVLYYFNPLIIEDIKIKILQAHNNDQIFSAESITKRINRYKLIHQKQEEDLHKMIDLLVK